MTIAWTTNPGGIFRRFGVLFAAVNEGNVYRGTAVDADVTLIDAQYPSTTGQQIAVNSLYQDRNNSRGLIQTWLSQLTAYASSTLINQANDDTTLPQLTTQAALTELIAQMVTNSQTIDAPAVTATVTADGDNDGDAVFVASVVGADGTQLDYTLAETVRYVCTADAGSGTGGGGTQYAETFTGAGAPSRSPLEYNWPGGSGYQGTVQATDAATTTANKLSNGSFETWPVAVEAPTNWTYAVGTGGTAFVRSASPYRSDDDYAMQLVSDGSTVLKLRQDVTASLVPNTVYAVNCWAKIDAAAAGAVVFRLVDGSGTVIADNAGTNNSVSMNTNSLTTSYQALKNVLTSGTPFFRTPRALPTTVYLEIAMTTPPTTGTDVTIDLVAVVPATQLYTSGPFVAAFSGATPSIRLDEYAVALANDRTACQFVFVLDRAFDLRGLNLKIPSGNSPTIADTLITSSNCP